MACPFGVPKYYAEIDQMMKCDMCYDRTSVGKRPMCATVCPSGALAFTTLEEIERTRQGVAINEWRFGHEVVRTKVYVVVPPAVSRVEVGLVQINGAAEDARLPAASDPYDVAVLLGEG
jgi:Fe-S-cluster-containing dehydrogenase component